MSKGVVHIPNEAEAWSHVDAWSRMDEIAVVFDCPHTTPKLTDHGVYVVRSQDIRGRRFDTSSAGRVSEDTYVERIARAVPEYGDLLYSREGTYFGISAPVPRCERVCLGQRMTLLRPDPAKVDHIFLNYWLNSDLMERFLAGYRDGSVAQRLNMSTIRGLPVPMLPISEQRNIARTLQVLDDKIELNRRMRATLEEMARALYRSWFVDFDPVHARALGQPPAHMDTTTAALFPDSFGPDGLPKGWETCPLSELCTQVKKTVKPMAAPEAEFLHFSLPAFDAGRMPIRELGAAIKSNKAHVPNDAILFSRLNPSIPRVWWAKTEATAGTPAASTEFFVAGAHDPIETPWLYCLLSSSNFRDEALSRVTGTSNSHQRIPPKALAEIEVIASEPEVVKAFGDLTRQWFERVHAMALENQTLASLRDTLLPRLMSGELRIREAEKEIEEVV